jgi:quercetin dioxygenase-like cupin family protein
MLRELLVSACLIWYHHRMEIFRPEAVPAEEPESMPGVKIRWVIDKKRGAENFAMRVFEVDPGASTPLHDHWYEQEMYLLAGEGVMVGVTGEQHLEPGVVMWVPPYERHQIKNTGSETLKFICCVPQKKP